MRFQYVSNAGIVLEIGEKKIGIDCFAKDETGLYQDTPQHILEELILDVLIITHEHADHFCAAYVKEAQRRNPDVQIYTTEATAAFLNGNVHIVTDGTTIYIEEMQICFRETIHEGDMYANVTNLTLYIKKEDKRIVFTGDARPCRELFEQISEWSKAVTWFFAPFPYVGLRSNRKLMNEFLRIDNIFVLHQPREEADVQNWVANTKLVCERAKDGLPKPMFPVGVGEWFFL